MNVAVRAVALASAGTTYVLVAAILGVSYKVLHPRRPSKRLMFGGSGGFLWLHIVLLATAFQTFVTWGVVEVFIRVTDPITFRPYVLLFATALMNVGYMVILRIETARYRMRVSVTD